MRHCTFGILCMVGAFVCGFFPIHTVLAQSPQDVLVRWFDALEEVANEPPGVVMDTMLTYYTGDLQDEFSPEVDLREDPHGEWKHDKAVHATVALHKEWIAFLSDKGFTRANFEKAEVLDDGDLATLTVTSERHVKRRFQLVNLPGRGWVIYKLDRPDVLGNRIRILVIIVAVSVALGIVARKMIFQQ